jgi:hypothetical protein
MAGTLFSLSLALATLLVARRSAAQDVVPPGAPPATEPTPEPPARPISPAPIVVDGSASQRTANVDDSALGVDGHPLAGFHNGLFYLRDANDNVHLFVQGRAQIDFFSYLGGGVPETTLKPTLFLRRIRPEFSGDFLHHFNFMFAGDFGATAIDNPRGTNETSAAPPGTVPTVNTARFASAQTTRFQAIATDVFINYRAGTFFNVQFGQFDAPFMMDNRTSDKYTAFMERALPVRALGVPSNKEIGAMAWGETDNRVFYYSVGPFNGDGMNRPNIDSRFDVMGRLFVHPLAASSLAKDNPLKDLQLGGSIRYGSRDKKWVDYDYPVMTTQGAYAFWAPTYIGAAGATHIIPSGDQLGAAAEVRIPFDRFDATGEFLYLKNGTREAIEGFEATNSERFGDIKGISYYAQLGYWISGKRDINGLPGYESPPRLSWARPDPAEPDTAVQLLAKVEQISLKYGSASRGGVADAQNIDGNIKVNALSFGINYWATRHIRLTLNYVYNQFPDSAPVRPTTAGGPQQNPANRALAPGNTLAPGLDDHARDSAHDLHEILARLAVAL